MSAREAILSSLNGPVPAAAKTLAAQVEERHPGCAVLLYGSGISTLSEACPSEVLYDFYAIVPSYAEAYNSALLRAANRAIPPNVFYIEQQSDAGLLRAKYAVLSIAHFKALVSARTHHSYTWARFAQPSRIVSAPEAIKPVIADIIETAISTFIKRSAPLSETDDIDGVWLAGLKASYRAELRAENQDRVDRLLESYGAWPQDVTSKNAVARARAQTSAPRARFGWTVRRYQGALLSVVRLLKGVVTFEGGVEYILWKISRHAGFSIPVKPWERRWPILAIPTLTLRYYRLKAAHAHQNR